MNKPESGDSRTEPADVAEPSAASLPATLRETLEWIITEIGAGKCLIARGQLEQVHNNACDRAIAIIRNYQRDEGLFQMTQNHGKHGKHGDRSPEAKRMLEILQIRTGAFLDRWMPADPREKLELMSQLKQLTRLWMEAGGIEAAEVIMSFGASLPAEEKR